MNLNNFPRWITLPLLSMLIIIACGLLPASPPVPIPVTGQNTATEAISTATAQPTPTAIIIIKEVTVTSPATSFTPSPSCTVLQDLNLRSGPGTAFSPPITTLPVNRFLTPLGFAPKGIPGGSWAYVQDSASQDKGWVSAGTQYISCNIEVTSLSLVAFNTPLPPPLPNTSQTSPGPGTCEQGGVFSDNGTDVYDCAVLFSKAGLIQFKVLKNGQEVGKADGVQNVNFSVTQKGTTIYNHTENTAPYCIFGGDVQCNSWVLENYAYKWEEGGSIVENKKYTVSISATLDDQSVNLFWSADITMALP